MGSVSVDDVDIGKPCSRVGGCQSRTGEDSSDWHSINAYHCIYTDAGNCAYRKT